MIAVEIIHLVLRKNKFQVDYTYQGRYKQGGRHI